jgi:hypothetical protein
MASSTPPEVLLKKIEKRFREYLPQECDHILNECTCLFSGCGMGTHSMIGVRLCQNYDLSVDELFWKWGATKHQNRETHRLDAFGLQELKIFVAQEQAKPSRPTNKGSSARLSGMMPARSGASGYGPGRIPRQIGGGFMSGVKREDVDSPIPAAGSRKVLFSQVDKVERRECKCLAVANPMETKLVRLQIVTCTRNCRRGVTVGVPSYSKAPTINQISFAKFWTKGSTIWLR